MNQVLRTFCGVTFQDALRSRHTPEIIRTIVPNTDGDPAIASPHLTYAEVFTGIRPDVDIGSVKLSVITARKHGPMLHAADPGDRFRHEGSPVVAGDDWEPGRERKHRGRIENPRSSVNTSTSLA